MMFVFQSAGIGAVGVGLWNMVDGGEVITDAVNFILDPSLVLIALGVVTNIVAFPGCLGALREHVKMLKVVGSGFWGFNLCFLKYLLISYCWYIILMVFI